MSSIPQRIPAQSTQAASSPKITDGYFMVPNSIAENVWAFTFAELCNALASLRIQPNKGARFQRKPTISDRTWSDWTGLTPRMKDKAIQGLRDKGLDVDGEGQKAQYRFDRSRWETWLRCHPREKAKTAGFERRKAAVKPKEGQQIHPECREHGCQKLCASSDNVVSITRFPATQVEKQVSQENKASPPELLEPVEFPERSAAPSGKPTETAETRTTTKRAVSQQDRSSAAVAQAALDPHFTDFLGIFVSLGVAIGPRDIDRCHKLWRELELAEQLTAKAYALARHEDDWQDREERYVPRPWNYLSEKHWERKQLAKGRQRGAGKAERAQREAARIFMEDPECKL